MFKFSDLQIMRREALIEACKAVCTKCEGSTVKTLDEYWEKKVLGHIVCLPIRTLIKKYESNG